VVLEREPEVHRREAGRIMNRDEVHADWEIKHKKRLTDLRRTIRDTVTDREARDAFVRAVLSLPGVACDPVTVPDIKSLTDTLLFKVSLDNAPDNCPDTCWINGPHLPHTWGHDGHRHACDAVVTEEMLSSRIP
jgi:hypothetical protein